LPGEEIKISGGTRKMRRKHVINDEAWLISHESSRAEISGTNHDACEVVDAVVN